MKLKYGKVYVRVKMLNPDKLLNILWNKEIKINNIKKIDVATLDFDLDYNDFNELSKVVKEVKGKVKILEAKGSLFLYLKIKKSISLAIGGVLFFALIFYLSSFVWSVEINTTKNISPFEIRKILYKNGITPGVNKDNLDVADIERMIEDNNRDVLWVRARIEGSSLRILIEEKVNPPYIYVGEYGNLTASIDGEVSRVYTYSGRAVVKEGDIVRKGDILIEGIIGSEGNEVEVPPRGVVIANTFIEKTMVIKTKGTIEERNGKKDTDIYLNFGGKKFYLKKATKKNEKYDKIEDVGSFINKVTYYEKIDKEISLTKEEAINKASIELQNSLINELTREAKIVDKVLKVNDEDTSNISISIVFVIEQDIVNNIPIEN